MKTKYWLLLLGALLMLCLGLSLLTLAGAPAARAEIVSGGKVVRIVELSVDQEFTVVSETGYNVITVKDGKIAVTEANCPDHYCMRRGFCNSGSQIVCLPNRLVIRFVAESKLDGVSG